MLPRNLEKLKAVLEGKYSLSSFQHALLAELKEIDRQLDEDDLEILEESTKERMRKEGKDYYSVVGPTPGTCPTCGRSW